MPDGTKWGIYVSPQPGTVPSSNTITGSGQITMVAPLNFAIVDFNPVSGFWQSNAVINGPTENPTKTYISFGLMNDVPKIVYSPTTPTLLFTFRKAANYCPDELYLIENTVDPFDQLPNSANSNPGNEITVIDFGTTPPSIFEYGTNIGLFAWDCHDCDGDGIPNALEDTNGDGQWTPGVDVSDLCNGAGGCLEITSAQLRCQSGGTACGNNPAGPLSLVVDITGGQAPYTVKYSDGTNTHTLQDYQSGTPFTVPAANGAIYSLVEIKEAEGCVANSDDFMGVVNVVLTPGTILFASQPANATICNTASTSFEACVTGTTGSYNIRWESSSNQGATWQTVSTASGVFSESALSNGCKTLYVNNANGLNGYLFRAIAEGTNITTITSQAATLTVQGPLTVASHPQNVKVCSGETVVFNAGFANGGGGNIEYTWQLSHNNGATWWDAMPAPGTSGINSNQLTIQNIEGIANGDIYRLQARVGNCGFVYTQTALLTVEGPLEVEQQPVSVKVCNGETAIFSAAIGNFGGGSIQYQWELSHDNGGSWSEVAPSAIFAGANTPTLTLNSTTSSLNADIFRLRAKVGNCDAVYSQSAQLTVEGPVNILAVLSPVTLCRGEEACFEVQASLSGGGQLSYQWQERQNGSATWTNVQGTTSANFCLANTDGRNGNCYRALVRTESCDPVTTAEACLVVEGRAIFAQQPQNTTICNGEAATLTADAAIEAGYAGQLAYRWQTSADGGQSWQDLNNDFNVEGAYDVQLTINDAAAIGNLLYRLSATTGICEATYSDAVGITVEGPIEIGQQPADMTICAGAPANFTASAELLGNGNLQLQWQTSTNGIDWTNIAVGNNYTGTQSENLTVQNANTGRLFRLSASTAHCGATNTDPATLTVEAPIVFTEQPASATVCPDDAVSFNIGVSGGTGPLSLQWQSSTGGLVWANIAQGGLYDGTQTSTLTIASAAGLDGKLFRLVAASQNCSETSAPAVLTLEADEVCNPTPEYRDCVSLAVKKLDGNIGWSVWVKADSSFTETPYQLPTGGKVTLVAPAGFAIQGLTSFNGGTWNPGKVFFNPPQDPGKVYVEFNLTPNQNFLELTPGGERLLFSFSVIGGCPSSLGLMDSIVPQGFFPNEFTGFGSGLTRDEIPFHFCGNYGESTWQCPPTSNLMAPTSDGTLHNAQQLNLDPSKKATDEIGSARYFGVAPNPVRDELKVSFDENTVAKSALLRLMNLQGQVVYQTVVEGEATHRMNLGNTIPGTYFLTLEVDGKLVQREKIIVQ